MTSKLRTTLMMAAVLSTVASAGCDENTDARGDTEGSDTDASSTGQPETSPDTQSGSGTSGDPSDSDAETGLPPQGTTTANESDSEDPATGESGTDETTGGEESDPKPGAVFVLTNEDGPNGVLAFVRGADGGLERLGEFATGGMGTGGGLGSQGALALDSDANFLYVVNAGDDSVSALQIYEDHVALVDVVGSEGHMPTSLALNGNHLYVLNAEGAGSVAGFEIEAGRMAPIPGAMRPLSGDMAPAPAQVGVTPDGGYVVVTERATNQILTYEINADGSLEAPFINASEGDTPFGFDFGSDGVMVVSEAFGGGANPGASAASSYRVADGGMLWVFSSSVPSGQTAACWIQIVRDQFAYSTNTGSDNLSGYALGDQGEIELFPQSGSLVELGEEHRPIDMAVSRDESFLYVLNGAADDITVFEIEDDGMLTEQETITVPETAVGLIGF